MHLYCCAYVVKSNAVHHCGPQKKKKSLSCRHDWAGRTKKKASDSLHLALIYSSLVTAWSGTLRFLIWILVYLYFKPTEQNIAASYALRLRVLHEAEFLHHAAKAAVTTAIIFPVFPAASIRFVFIPRFTNLTRTQSFKARFLFSFSALRFF